MIVVDASALLEVLLRSSAGRAAQTRLFAPGESLHAPHLIDIEVAQTLRRLVAHAGLDGARAKAALTDLSAFSVRRYSHDWLLPRVWELRANLTAYDAPYVALAEALDATLVTCDGRLAAAPGNRARVDLIPLQLP
jgi:predicted nucleic acid-binding protein